MSSFSSALTSVSQVYNDKGVTLSYSLVMGLEFAWAHIFYVNPNCLANINENAAQLAS